MTTAMIVDAASLMAMERIRIPPVSDSALALSQEEEHSADCSYSGYGSDGDIQHHGRMSTVTLWHSIVGNGEIG
jgi:hypothetical protein